MEKEDLNKSDEVKKKHKNIFKNFPEYWYFVRVLTKEQREKLVEHLSIKEREFLTSSFKKGCWDDVMMRNLCDSYLDHIKDTSGIDLIELRSNVLKNKPQLVQKNFWINVSQIFSEIKDQHTNYIFANLAVDHFDDTYFKISKK